MVREVRIFVSVIRLVCCTNFVTCVKWPNPKDEEVVYVNNPIEAGLPGHWVPLSILKMIIEKRATLAGYTTRQQRLQQLKHLENKSYIPKSVKKNIMGAKTTSNPASTPAYKPLPAKKATVKSLTTIKPTKLSHLVTKETHVTTEPITDKIIDDTTIDSAPTTALDLVTTNNGKNEETEVINRVTMVTESKTEATTITIPVSTTVTESTTIPTTTVSTTLLTSTPSTTTTVDPGPLETSTGDPFY